MEKKQASDWYLALTHTLTSGFVIPLLIGIVYAFAVAPFLGFEQQSSSDALLTVAVSLFSLWLGVMYSARYINASYVITDPSRIVNLSTIYFAVLVGVFLIADVITFLNADQALYAAIDSAGLIASCGLFYYVSKKRLG